MKKEEIKVCKHCVMNTTDTNLVLDENGVCDRCHDYDKRILPWWNHGEGHEAELQKLLADITGENLSAERFDGGALKSIAYQIRNFKKGAYMIAKVDGHFINITNIDKDGQIFYFVNHIFET